MEKSAPRSPAPSKAFGEVGFYSCYYRLIWQIPSTRTITIQEPLPEGLLISSELPTLPIPRVLRSFRAMFPFRPVFRSASVLLIV
jgi:hypothetical protein